jgi:hypothetical protein
MSVIRAARTVYSTLGVLLGVGGEHDLEVPTWADLAPVGSPTFAGATRVARL